MKKLVWYLILYVTLHEHKVVGFFSPARAAFHACIKEAARHPDVKGCYLVMLGCPRLQEKCLQDLHNAANKIFAVRLMTDAPYDSWKYPYFSQIEIKNEKQESVQHALFFGKNGKRLVAITIRYGWLRSHLEIMNNPNDLDVLHNFFSKR